MFRTENHLTLYRQQREPLTFILEQGIRSHYGADIVRLYSLINEIIIILLLLSAFLSHFWLLATS